MTAIPAKCAKITTDPHIVFNEKKSKITFENPERNTYISIQVDGCVFKAEDGIKCDKLLESEAFGDQYFVELKGGDTKKAVEQIEETINRIPPRINEARRMAFAVFSNTSPRCDPKRQAIEKRFKVTSKKSKYPNNILYKMLISCE